MMRALLATTALLAPLLASPPALAESASCAPSTFAGAWRGEVTLCQNWDAAQQHDFWFLPQGSLILPYDWFVSLEQADNRVPFIDPDYMDGFRYLPQQPLAGRNPDGLPIGFTRDDPRHIQPFRGISKQWLGMTCAACHTGQIELTRDGRTRRVLVDGAPTMADFQGLFAALVDAMQATLADDQKFERLFVAVMQREGERPTRRARARLRRDFEQMLDIRRAWNERNQGVHPYGFARLDAIGAILNEVSATAAGVPSNVRPADAPVSYPYLWDTPHYDRVQWNGSVENKGPGALARNVGEVLGVFGGLDLRQDFGHRSSINLTNLGKLEQLIATLRPPAWPEDVLGAIDRSDAVQARGRAAFERFCAGCHAATDAPGVSPPFKARMMHAAKIGTDETMATNFAARMSESGPLAGLPSRYVTGERIAAPESRSTILLGYAVSGTLTYEALWHLPEFLVALKAGKSSLDEAASDGSGSLLTRVRFEKRPSKDVLKRFLDRLENDTDQPRCAPAVEACYKARSLNGIWATAPYLHNGSVRTLRQLLLPAASREVSFRVGSREYDPQALGFENAGGFELDTTLPGNHRVGHEGPAYGNQAFAEDPALLNAMLEYLKTL